ncbi:hypothetical protein OESDEN_02095 [Oesophagostomum dentatum]|uniref:Nematode fatty acid retinoid binding protein n=1 Tax=Oesophagostomum dentatum TaxID=61180 RepID=A0A0B1TKX8_OESDE|nr:hypothetical protein OESDEN_02095 [Oesophagostomum dentatum]
MRRLVFFLLLAVVCFAEVSNDELSKYGSEIFNDCTTCNLLNAAREQPELLNEFAMGISALPDPFRSRAMMIIKEWTVKVATVMPKLRRVLDIFDNRYLDTGHRLYSNLQRFEKRNQGRMPVTRASH